MMLHIKLILSPFIISTLSFIYKYKEAFIMRKTVLEKHNKLTANKTPFHMIYSSISLNIIQVKTIMAFCPEKIKTFFFIFTNKKDKKIDDIS